MLEPANSAPELDSVGGLKVGLGDVVAICGDGIAIFTGPKAKSAGYKNVPTATTFRQFSI